MFGRILAYFGNKVVGGIAYSAYDNEMWIKHIETIEEMRRKGVATQLMRFAEEVARNNGWSIKRSLTTDDGTNFLNKYDTTKK